MTVKPHYVDLLYDCWYGNLLTRAYHDKYVALDSDIML